MNVAKMLKLLFKIMRIKDKKYNRIIEVLNIFVIEELSKFQYIIY